MFLLQNQANQNTSDTKSLPLSGPAETLFITLYLRAMESQRPDALIKDEKAVELVSRLDYDFNRIKPFPLNEINQTLLMLRSREFDRLTNHFLKRHPEAAVVHIGCGLDSRFDRVDNGRTEWYDLDLENVIALRRQFIGGNTKRYHLLGGSVFDNFWLKTVIPHRRRPLLFLAEGVFVHFEESQVRALVLKLRDHFPGTELVFDAFSPLHIWTANLQMAATGLDYCLHWGLWDGRQVERWGKGIRLLGDTGFLDWPQPRLDCIRWMRYFPLAARAGRIYHFRLENPE